MKEYGNLRKDVNMANLDNLMLELRCDSDMLKAVHVAMAEGQDRADNYTNALFGVLIAFWNLIDKFSNEIYEEVPRMTEILHNDHGEPINRTDHIADINRLLALADFRKVSLVWTYASHLIKEVPADGKAR